MHRYLVLTDQARPDYRLVISFLWHDLYNVDTDGNAEDPASRQWTQLYIRNRQDGSEIIDIFPVSEQPLILQIESTKRQLAAHVTYFLAAYMSAGVADSQTGPF